MVKEITPADVYRLHQESAGLVMIDVREPAEYAEMCAPFSENMPLSAFDPQAVARKFDRTGSVYLICRSGARSLRAAELLLRAGFVNVYNVSGGMLAWKAGGFPVCGP